MKLRLILGVVVLGGILTLSSCGEDEVPKSGITFELEEQEVTESDGTPSSFHPDEDGIGRVVTAKILFDRPLAKDVVIAYDIDGLASQTKTSNELNDFEIVEEGDNITVDDNNITVKKGVSEALISFRIFEDYDFEYGDDFPENDDGIPYEGIEITLESIVSGPGTLGEDVTHEVKILEDDTYVYLGWDPNDQAGTGPGDVNMDLFIYINNQLRGVFAYSDNQYPYEVLVISGGFPNGTFGMGYVYKTGTSNDLNFVSQIINFGGTLTTAAGESGVGLTTPGKYTSVNKNDYNASTPTSQIEQTMVKNGLNYGSISAITAPTSGSREITKSRRELLNKILKAKPPLVLKKNF
jgi:hypothetical protein